MPTPTPEDQLIKFGVAPRHWMLPAWLALLILLAPKVGAQTSLYGNSPEEIKATLTHLKNTVPVYQGQIDKVEHHNPYEAMWQQGQDMKNFGLDTLREMDVKKAFLDVAEAAGEAKFKTAEGDNKYLIAKKLKQAVEGTKWLNDLSDFVEKREKQKASVLTDDHDLKGQIDHLIEEVEAARDGGSVFKGAVTPGIKIIDPQAVPDKLVRYTGYTTSAALTALYIARAGVSSGDERLAYAMKGEREASDASLKFALVGTSRATGATAALAKINGELLVRLSVWGISTGLGENMQKQAEVLRDNTVSELSWNLRDADIKIDLAEQALKRAENHPLKEPGGIKFNRERADDLAFALDITSIEYDPASGKLIFSGTKSQQVFDVNVFADILRLAVEDMEPFFSLDLSNAKDWDYSIDREHALIRARYSDAQIAERVRAICRNPIEHGNRTYYYASIDNFDPALFLEANKGRDISEKLIFSPEWLRHSEVGWMLYEADLAIKSVASGFLERGTDLVPSPAWDIPGFDPIWLNHGTEGHAGRANFELDERIVSNDGGRLDLSEIRPKLVVMDRKAGTMEDFPPPPSPRNAAISRHFSEHWNDYVERVPEIARLEMLYRAYVGARFLVHNNPGLVARILQMPRSAQLSQNPLRIIRPSVIRVCYENGQPAPMEQGYSCWGISRGYGGGAEFKMDNMTIQKSPAATVSWARNALGSSNSTTAFVEQGDEVAIALEVAVDPVPSSILWILKIVLGSLMGFVALAGLLARRFDWQQIAITRTCEHCGRVHSWLGRSSLLGDVVAAGLLFYLLALPFVTAAYDKEFELRQYLILVVLVAGAMCALVVTGAALHALVILVSRRRVVKMSPLGAFFCGSRFASIMLSCALLHGGISEDAVTASLCKLIGRDPGQRLLVLLGDPRLITYAAIAMLAAALVAFLLRWLVPLVCGSRPLYFMKTTPHTHSATAAAL